MLEDSLLVPMTVVETSVFAREAAAALTEEERTELIAYLAANPEAGDVHARDRRRSKAPMEAQGLGKRGGVRAI